MSDMTDDAKQELHEIWTLFSELSCRARQVADNSISIQELPALLRALGQNPSEAEMAEIYAKADPMGTQSVQYNTFLQFAGGLVSNREQDIVEAFRVFDREGKAQLHTGDLRHAMCTLGEKFDDIEVDEMIKEAGVKGGEGMINYEDFAKKITQT